jgi:hypothetical protein
MKKLLIILFAIVAININGQIPASDARYVHRGAIQMLYSDDTLDMYYAHDTVNFYNRNGIFNFNSAIGSSGAMTSSGLLTLTGTTGIKFTNTAITKGIDFGYAKLVGSSTYANSALSYGTNSSPVYVTSLAGHYVPLQITLNSSASAAYDVAAARLKIITDADTAPTLANHTVLQLRGTINGNAGSFTGLSSSVNVASATTLGAIGLGAGYFNIQGSGAITSATSGAYVLSATSTHTSTGVTDVGAFSLNASGGTVTNIGHIFNTVGTTTNMLNIVNVGGIATNGLNISGTYSNAAITSTGKMITTRDGDSLKFDLSTYLYPIDLGINGAWKFRIDSLGDILMAGTINGVTISNNKVSNSALFQGKDTSYFMLYKDTAGTKKIASFPTLIDSLQKIRNTLNIKAARADTTTILESKAAAQLSHNLKINKADSNAVGTYVTLTKLNNTMYIGDTTVTAVKGRMVFKTSDSTLYICRTAVAVFKKWYTVW